MLIGTLKKFLAHQRQPLFAKVTELLAIQNVIDEVWVSKSELKNVGHKLQHQQKPQCDTNIRHLRCNNYFLQNLLVRRGELGDKVHESVVWKDVESAFKGVFKPASSWMSNTQTFKAFSRTRKLNF